MTHAVDVAEAGDAIGRTLIREPVVGGDEVEAAAVGLHCAPAADAGKQAPATRGR